MAGEVKAAIERANRLGIETTVSYPTQRMLVTLDLSGHTRCVLLDGLKPEAGEALVLDAMVADLLEAVGRQKTRFESPVAAARRTLSERDRMGDFFNTPHSEWRRKTG